MKRGTAALMVATLAASGCGSSHCADKAGFQAFVDSFVSEASARGKTTQACLYQIVTQDQVPPYEDSRTVAVSGFLTTTVFLSNYAKETGVQHEMGFFHEMGIALLGRSDNDFTPAMNPDGQPASLMTSHVDLMDSNYYLAHRAIYLDELFSKARQ